MTTYQSRNSAARTDEWLTPPFVLDALGPFDLDPCAVGNPPWQTASHSYTKANNGLAQEWHGRVWCNPPYSQRELQAFTERCIEHRAAILCIFARTDTRLWQRLIFPNATAILFLAKRLRFHHPDGTLGAYAPAPSALIAFDAHGADTLRNSGLPGALCIPAGNTPK